MRDEDDDDDHVDDGAEDVATFCERTRDRLVRAVTAFCGDRGVAEDAVQEAYVRAWERWPTVSRAASPEGWTFVVATNLCRSWGRRRTLERRWRDRQAGGRQGDPAREDSDVVDHLALAGAVRALPARQRATIVARYLLDLDVATTARVMDCTPGTVKAATHHALAALRAAGVTRSDVDPSDADHRGSGKEVCS